MGQSESTLASQTKASNVRKNPCLHEAKEKLYADRNKSGDVKFLVGTEVIHAHRCVLAALSPKYEAQFYGAIPEKNVILVANVSAAAFKEFLQFFYTADVTLTIENIEDVLNLAQQSLNEKLVTECTDFLLETIALDKLCWCYQLALFHGIKTLQEFCEDHISVNIKKVFETKDFLSCEPDVLCRILGLDTLNCNETEVFDACISWALTVCKQNESDSKKAANLRAALGDAIFQIRFYSMTVEEFAAIDKKYSGLLSVQESNEVYRVIGKASDAKSSVFNCNGKPRVPKTVSTTRNKDEVSKKPIMECILSDGRILNNWGDTKSDCDTMAFICDKAIQLHGFYLCIKITDKLEVDIEIGIRDLKNYKHKSSITEDKAEFTKVIFAEPIQVNRNERCFIMMKSKHFKQPGPRYSTKLEVVENGVWFQMLNPKPGDTKPKTFTRLMYTICDQ